MHRHLKLETRRLDREGQYETIIERDDGVRFAVQGVAHNFAIALGIESGFCGAVAAGAVFPTMRHLSGRRKPKASERSKLLLLNTNARTGRG